jgi:hypothetical protein
MVNFFSDDWKFVKEFAERRLTDFRNILENPDKTYKEKLIANGRILAYREFLNLPQSAKLADAAQKSK